MRIIAPGCTGVAISVSGIVGIVRMVLVMIAGNVEKFGDRRGLETPVAETLVESRQMALVPMSVAHGRVPPLHEAVELQGPVLACTIEHR